MAVELVDYELLDLIWRCSDEHGYTWSEAVSEIATIGRIAGLEHDFVDPIPLPEGRYFNYFQAVRYASDSQQVTVSEAVELVERFGNENPVMIISVH